MYYEREKRKDVHNGSRAPLEDGFLSFTTISMGRHMTLILFIALRQGAHFGYEKRQPDRHHKS